MGKPKNQSKKQQQKRGGIDFKKIKRKIGRKLPPPKNSTDLSITSKAIVLPEQSVASEKAGLAVSRKGLTLKELLQQTSHHNAKVRKDALVGIKDIFLKYPTELKLHKLATVEKLRERISDTDKSVREILYELFKSVIFPGCKEDNQGPFISLMVAYIFNSMTHLAMDVRLMAFNFFDLVVQNYPCSFSLYSEKILQNYHNILQKSQFNFHDKSKLKGILSGLAHCLELLPSNKRDDHSSAENEVASQGILHAYEPDEEKDSSGLLDTIKMSKNLLPVLVSYFKGFFSSNPSTPLLDAQSYDCMLYILQSIDHIVEFFAYQNGETEKAGQGILQFNGKQSHAAVSDQTVSPEIFKSLWFMFPLNSASEKEDDQYFILNAIITKISLRLRECCSTPFGLSENFLEFIESSLIEKSSNCNESSKVYKHMLPLVPFVPNLVVQVSPGWRSRILQAFTEIFKTCSPESDMKSTCLSAIRQMLDPEKEWLFTVSSDPQILNYHLKWIGELPELLLLLGHKMPSRSKIVLQLLLLIGKAAKMNTYVNQVYDQKVQNAFAKFYSVCLNERSVSHGPFSRLTLEVQELSLSCVYYFSSVDPSLLQSLAACCLCQDLDPILLSRIIEVLHSAYKVGNIAIGNYISFLITLLAHFEVSPESPSVKDLGASRHSTFKSIIRTVCSYLSEIGDEHLTLQILEKLIIDQMSLKLPLDNICAFLRVLTTLDHKPTRLCDQSIIKLSDVLLKYLTDVAISMQHDDSEGIINVHNRQYYLLPSFFMFDRSSALLSRCLDSTQSMVEQSTNDDSRANLSAVVSVLILMLEDVKMQQVLFPHSSQIKNITESVLVYKSKNINFLKLEEKHKLQSVCDKLRAAIRRALGISIS